MNDEGDSPWPSEITASETSSGFQKPPLSFSSGPPCFAGYCIIVVCLPRGRVHGGSPLLLLLLLLLRLLLLGLLLGLWVPALGPILRGSWAHNAS